MREGLLMVLSANVVCLFAVCLKLWLQGKEIKHLREMTRGLLRISEDLKRRVVNKG